MVVPPIRQRLVTACEAVRYFFSEKLRFYFTGSILRLLGLLVFIATLPALCIILLTGFEARQQALLDAERNTLLLARGIGEIQERATRGIRHLLEQLAAMPQVKAGDLGAVTDQFKAMAAAFPVVPTIVPIGADGKSLFPDAAAAENNSVEPDLLRLARDQGVFTAGEFTRTTPDNLPAFPFVQPLRDAAGQMIGLAVATIHLDTYGALFADAALPPDSVLSIVDRNGRRILRTPRDAQSGIGSLLPPTLLEAVLRPDTPRGVVERTGADGIGRIYAFNQLRLAPGEAPYLTIVVGIPQRHGQASANALLWRNLILLALALVLALAVAWLLGSRLLGRRLDTLVAVTGRLRAGDLTARIGLPLASGALGRLEHSVNDMAEALAESAQAARRSEASLRESEAVLRNVADFTYDWEYWKGPDGRFLWIAPACRRISGHGPEDFLADPELMFTRIIHPDDAALWSEHAGEEEAARQEQRSLELRIIKPNGQLVWIHHHCRPIFDQDGTYLGLRGCNRDISARKTAEEALRRSHEKLEARVQSRTFELKEANARLTQEVAERARVEENLRKSEEKYRIFYEQSTVGIFIMTASGIIQDANPAACEILGYSAEGLRGMGYEEIIAPDDLLAQPIDYERFHSGQTSKNERVFVGKDGRRVPASVSGRLVADDLYQAVFRDISERKKLEQLRDDVDRITRHDLKAPLMGVINMPTLLFKNKTLPAKDIELLHLIQESGYRMLRMVNMSLALYQMETGAYQCQRQLFDLLGTVARVLRDTRTSAEDKEIGLSVLLDGSPVCPGDRFPVVGEELLTLTMLENLLKNAIEASPPAGTCVIACDSRRQTLRITNPGEVPEAIRDRFFEKYVTAGKRWGTGLGTYSAWLIARANGWAIALSCAALGQTTVTLTFPEAVAHPETKAS